MDDRNVPRLSDITKADVHDALSRDYAKWLGCLSETNLPRTASEVFLQRFPHTYGTHIVRKALELEGKAAIGAGTTTDAAWAGPLSPIKPFLDAFVALARSASLLGRINVRTVPFNTTIPFQSQDAGYQWVQQGAPKPVSKLAFAPGTILAPLKAAAIIVVTRELTQVSVPGAEVALRDTLIQGLTAFTDRSFLDPASTAIANTRPASVTSGTTPITATASYATDVATLLAAFFAGAPNAIAPVMVANASHASQLRTLNNGAGPGLPIIVSQAALGNTIVLDPNQILVADNGVSIDASSEASFEMNDAPTTPAATTIVTSLWQMNLSAFKVERFLNFTATTGSVKYLAG
jgi:hypothetical protein